MVTVNKYQAAGGLSGNVIRGILRTLQGIFAITIAGLYGVDLSHASATDSTAQSAWVYAELVAALSILTCLAHSLGLNQKIWWWVCVLWDWVMFIFWIALFGTFAGYYYGEEWGQGESGMSSEEAVFTTSKGRMRAAVWVDLVAVVCWFVTFVQGIGWCCGACRHNKGEKRALKLKKRQMEAMEEGKGERNEAFEMLPMVEQGTDPLRVEETQPRRASVVLMKSGFDGGRCEGESSVVVPPPPTYQNATQR